MEWWWCRAKPRRLLFNDDGGETRVPTEPLPKPKDFLPKRIAPLAGTHVDTIVFDTSSGTFGRVDAPDAVPLTACAQGVTISDGCGQAQCGDAEDRHGVVPSVLGHSVASKR